MLELKNVYAGYQGKDMIFDVNFRFETGRNYCLLGPNGCGKTTLIRAMSSLIPHRGEVLIDGTELGAMKRKDVARKIAVMSQITTLYFPYSVYDTVMLGRYQQMREHLFHQATAADRDTVRRCLEYVGLWDEREKSIDRLSGGQRQRVFLAQALAQEPELILLDEPTNHLDILHQAELIDALHDWTKDGKHSVIGVFHDINLALKLSENLLVMKEGRLVASGTFSEIATREFFQNVYDMDLVGYMQDSLGKWNSVP